MTAGPGLTRPRPRGHQGSRLQSACPKRGRQTQGPSGHIRRSQAKAPTAVLDAWPRHSRRPSQGRGPSHRTRRCVPLVWRGWGGRGCPPVLPSPERPASHLRDVLPSQHGGRQTALSGLRPSGLKSSSLFLPARPPEQGCALFRWTPFSSPRVLLFLRFRALCPLLPQTLSWSRFSITPPPLRLLPWTPPRAGLPPASLSAQQAVPSRKPRRGRAWPHVSWVVGARLREGPPSRPGHLHLSGPQAGPAKLSDPPAGDLHAVLRGVLRRSALGVWVFSVTQRCF